MLYTMLVFVIVIIPFYIGYFVLSNIRFGNYLLTYCLSKNLLLNLSGFYFYSQKRTCQNFVPAGLDFLLVPVLESW